MITIRIPQPVEHRPHDPANGVPWVHRGWRAHIDPMELRPSAAAVLITRPASVSNMVAIRAAALFFRLRVGHPVCTIGGFPTLPVRPWTLTGGCSAFP